ncbi:hypothetical protein [Bacillus toyonensis]|uniref:hypothetical protein n=1 Tax=Bacillus toyonensis TaxID=155322 RepID=UPI000BF2E52C|nr:hypothetical protein [Bacillus toyonensis]PGC90409.1 hypothetical protein COM39_14015 [Bacillus toyonensis]
MKLTKLEKAMVIRICMAALDKEELERCIDEDSLEQLAIELEEILCDSSLKEMMGAGRNGIRKMIQDVLEES